MKIRHISAILFTAITASVSLSAQEQYYYDDLSNPDIARHVLRRSAQRHEFILPAVNGYNIYKADLHTHSIYSDGDATPEFRVREAWSDGLDVIAITEHVEYRRHEGNMINFLKGYVPEGTKAFNHSIISSQADERGIQADLNLPVKLAERTARTMGVTVIPGAEITRTPETIGHYNALFTKDNNTIYDVDPVQSMRNAKAQGALIMHNHPGWRRPSLDYTEFEAKVYAEGLIDGIEVMNGGDFYPKAISRAAEKNLFVSSNTDIHESTFRTYRDMGHHRNMTLIFAKENTLESLREAIEARRTLAYSFGTFAGDEKLLTDLFHACVTGEEIYTDSKGRTTVRLTNRSSAYFIIVYPGSNPYILEPFSSVNTTVGKNSNKTVRFTVGNMWCSDDKHPAIEIKL